METVLVSVVVPCYKQAHFLTETLQSVLDQTYNYWECIIVNDGSPDNTEEIALDWCGKDSRFKYLFKENGGLSSARNAGIKISNGEFILALDSDDILHKNYLLKLVPELHNDESLAIVSSYREFFRDNINNVFYKEKAKGSNCNDLMYENILTASSLYRKKCWEEVGGYDENMKKGFEDWEFWINITKRGWKFKFIEEFLFFYRKSKKSMLTDTLANHVESNIEYVYTKHKEIYIENFDMTLYYFIFLLKRYKTSEQKIKKSLEYKIGRIITKPLRFFKSKLKLYK
ncbi:glycosyl transferase family 2 [Flavobacterium sp. Root935]|jgi:glycosyltransferase involved in cell wall biosynthesis|uniref:glycosyltransferase family 2 protein n=1 Tax=unclassified Flavobacterium TaxID=196869 RepID=UPI0007104A46|nr:MULTISPECIES: glycosyltransferase family A protein [unclassified Flavobacterium]KRD63876.1 glycosyl transferase family 2 [Flavobacterium sp. Root935]MDQ1167491.1 glycosyltransferase involved in cell wall biosynthesis [Flavobacterium sp. SORGH_AS_0622]